MYVVEGMSYLSTVRRHVVSLTGIILICEHQVMDNTPEFLRCHRSPGRGAVHEARQYTKVTTHADVPGMTAFTVRKDGQGRPTWRFIVARDFTTFTRPPPGLPNSLHLPPSQLHINKLTDPQIAALGLRTPPELAFI